MWHGCRAGLNTAPPARGTPPTGTVIIALAVATSGRLAWREGRLALITGKGCVILDLPDEYRTWLLTDRW